MTIGLIGMYIFLAVFSTGLVVYAKIEDRKKGK